MKPFVVYMIGISGSGKTTVATKVTQKLNERGISNLQFIDGDVIRNELGDLFGYTYEERMKNNKAVCIVVNYLVRNNINVILAQVAGFQTMRDQVREKCGGDYIEIYVKCSAEECAKRDVKGYYKEFEEGKLQNLNGLDSTFDIPQYCDLVVDTEELSVDESVQKVMEYLEERGYI